MHGMESKSKYVYGSCVLQHFYTHKYTTCFFQGLYKCSRFSSCKFKIPISSLSPPFHVFQLTILLQSTNQPSHLHNSTILCTSHIAKKRREKAHNQRGRACSATYFRRNKAFSKVQKMFNGHSLSAFFPPFSIIILFYSSFYSISA